MTKDEINRKLAIGVMGWKLDKIDEDEVYRDDLRKPIIWFDEWNPWENIEQAMEVLGKFDAWNMCTTGSNRIECIIYEGGSNLGEGETPQEAICNAAISAIKEATDE